jgi:hypothetical protein
MYCASQGVHIRTVTYSCRDFRISCLNTLLDFNFISVIGNIPSNFLYSCVDLLLLWAENFYTTWRLRGTLKVLCNMHNKKIRTMKIEKFQRRGNNSVCAGAFQLLRSLEQTLVIGNNSGVCGGALGWGNMPHAEGWRVQSPMGSLRIFIDVIPPAGLWPWDRLSR